MRIVLLLIAILPTFLSLAQDNSPSSDNTSHLESLYKNGFITRANEKAGKLNDQLSRQTEKYLLRLLKKEKKLQKKLARKDSALAAEVFGDIEKKYASPVASLNGIPGKGQYLPHLDTLKTSLSFLEQNSQIISSAKDVRKKIQSSLQQVKSLQSKLKEADQVKEFIKQRRDQIKQALSKYTNLPKGVTKIYTEFNKEFYYYSQQVHEYKEALKDPDKLIRKALDLLGRTTLFQKFMSQHSEVAALFPMPSNYGTAQALVGLQTITQVQQLIQARLSGSGPNGQLVFQQNLQTAQQELNTLKDKMNKLGLGGSTDIDIPEFKPNNQRTKNFFQRLELGANFQTTRSSSFFPTTTDLGLTLGYKLSDKGVIGIGSSYKLGWGKDIRHIRISHQGVSLRSFVDWKIKGSFWLSGGFEMNHNTTFNSISLLKDKNSWRQSGLIGLSKIVSLKTKVIKRTKLQLFWDLLSYQQVPRTQPVVFRIGYMWR
jgi:hypothetical protein